jgi:hypothetical protein
MSQVPVGDPVRRHWAICAWLWCSNSPTERASNRQLPYAAAPQYPRESMSIAPSKEGGATCVHGDLFDYEPAEAAGLVTSVGLIEHYFGSERRRCMRAHV